MPSGCSSMQPDAAAFYLELTVKDRRLLKDRQLNSSYNEMWSFMMLRDVQHTIKTLIKQGLNQCRGQGRPYKLSCCWFFFLNRSLQDQGINQGKILKYIPFTKWQNILRNKCSKSVQDFCRKYYKTLLRDIGKNQTKWKTSCSQNKRLNNVKIKYSSK